MFSGSKLVLDGVRELAFKVSDGLYFMSSYVFNLDEQIIKEKAVILRSFNLWENLKWVLCISGNCVYLEGVMGFFPLLFLLEYILFNK